MVSLNLLLGALAVEGAFFAALIWWLARMNRDLLNRLMARDLTEYRHVSGGKPPTGRNHILKEKLRQEGGTGQ